MGITRENINLDALDVQANDTCFGRFDIFN